MEGGEDLEGRSPIVMWKISRAANGDMVIGKKAHFVLLFVEEMRLLIFAHPHGGLVRANQRSLQFLGVGIGNQRVVDAVCQEHGPLNFVGIIERGPGP